MSCVILLDGEDKPGIITLLPLLLEILLLLQFVFQLYVHNYKPAYDVVPGWEIIGTDDPLLPIERQRFLLLFQKMCVLDYVIRNTDRKMDNWLIRSAVF